MPALKILQLCHKMPFPLKDGGSHSIYHTAKGLLSKSADVKVIALDTPRAPVSREDIPPEFMKRTRFDSITVDTRIRPLHAFLNLFTDRSYLAARFFSKECNERLTGILDREEYDIIQLEHIYLCQYLEAI